jgi:uncharacterized protein YecE (DUF72 family)
MTSKNMFVGISGFSYAGWKGKFYPKEMKNEDFLAYYSEHLNSVEINSSFYAPPSIAMVKSWSAKTGEGFKFAFKAPKQITHILRLGKGSSEAAEKLSKTLDLLGPKRGPVLFQLPPYAKQDLKLLEQFLSSTAGTESRVFEFRHQSWLQDPTYELLDKYGGGFCVAETEDMDPVFKVTGHVAYFRLRKEYYDAKTVDKWSEKIRETWKGSRETYVYLRHDETGENADLARRLHSQIV